MTLARLIAHAVAQIAAAALPYWATAFVKADMSITAWGEDARFVTVMAWVWLACCAPMLANAILRAMEGREDP